MTQKHPSGSRSPDKKRLKELEKQLAAQKQMYEDQKKKADDRDNRARVQVEKALAHSAAEAKKNRERADKEIAAHRKAAQTEMTAFQKRMEAQLLQILDQRAAPAAAPVTASAAAPVTASAAAPIAAPAAAPTAAALVAALREVFGANSSAIAPSPVAATVLAPSAALVPSAPAAAGWPQVQPFGGMGVAFAPQSYIFGQQHVNAELQRLSGMASMLQQSQSGFSFSSLPFGGAPFPFGGGR